eukprot:jgi/Bigna1/81098/fgenesh1_pg.77_\
MASKTALIPKASLIAGEFVGPGIVTFAYLSVYYGFLLNAAFTKRVLERRYKAEDKKFDRYFGQDRVMLRADRIHLNTLEHMVPFLGMMWLHAVFVDVRSATLAGSIGTIARALYPFFLGSRKKGLGFINSKTRINILMLLTYDRPMDNARTCNYAIVARKLACNRGPSTYSAMQLLAFTDPTMTSSRMDNISNRRYHAASVGGVLSRPSPPEYQLPAKGWKLAKYFRFIHIGR